MAFKRGLYHAIIKTNVVCHENAVMGEAVDFLGKDRKLGAASTIDPLFQLTVVRILEYRAQD